MRPIHLFYCLSGFISLGYQVAWLRIYADRFGSTDLTFALLCHAYRDDPRFPSALYAWNTFGACCGVLVAEFVLLPRIGHNAMFYSLLGTNVLLAIYFLVLGRRGASVERGAADAGAV